MSAPATDSAAYTRAWMAADAARAAMQDAWRNYEQARHRMMALTGAAHADAMRELESARDAWHLSTTALARACRELDAQAVNW